MSNTMESIANVKVSSSTDSQTSQATAAQNVPSSVTVTKNVMDVLNERQRIALASKWAALKQAERDTYNEYMAAGITDSATLYVIATALTDANNKIFSDSRAEYLGVMTQWYQALTSSEASIKKFAEAELEKLGDKTTGAQQATLLSALKAKLLANRTFLPEPVEKSFRALCRFYGFDLNMIK